VKDAEDELIDITKAQPDGPVEEVKVSSSKKTTNTTDQKPSKKIVIEETKEDDLKSLLNFKLEDLKTHQAYED
jgi:hypothetical protein